MDQPAQNIEQVRQAVDSLDTIEKGVDVLLRSIRVRLTDALESGNTDAMIRSLRDELEIKHNELVSAVVNHTGEDRGANGKDDAEVPLPGVDPLREVRTEGDLKAKDAAERQQKAGEQDRKHPDANQRVNRG